MEEHEINLNDLPESSEISNDDEFIVVDKYEPLTELQNQNKKINYSTFKEQIIPENPRSGLRGDRGDKGIPGMSGRKGEKGNKGLKGNQGIQGLPGYFGFNGLKGEKGNTGELGDKGIIGSSGTKGLPGESGSKGETGDPGINGPRGLRGDKGELGDKGNKGIKGIPGDFNTKILLGKKGDKGPSGFGRKGAKGTKGLKGDRGDRGDRGRRGPTGSDIRNIELEASDMSGEKWVKIDTINELSFKDTTKTAYNENSRLLIKVNKGIYFSKWKTQNDLYAEVCLQNADSVKGPTVFSGYMLGLSDDKLYPIMLMPYSTNQNFLLKVCVFDGNVRFDLPYEIYECDEY